MSIFTDLVQTELHSLQSELLKARDARAELLAELTICEMVLRVAGETYNSETLLNAAARAAHTILKVKA